MTTFHEWLSRIRRIAFDNFEEKRGFRPAWPPVDTIRPGKYDYPMQPEERKPFDRRRIVFSAMRDCERDFECITKWLADPLAKHNHPLFEDQRWQAVCLYEQALHLADQLERREQLKPRPPGQIDLFGG